MRMKKLENETAIKFVEETLKLISERGGLADVNLRTISKRVGCAHTNAYNYFDGFEGLIWATYSEALQVYKEAIVDKLNNNLSGKDYFHQLIHNLISFAINSPGIYRFISSDPINIENMSEEIMGQIIELKVFYYEVFYELCKNSLDQEASNEAADILLSYLDGETFNLLNDRYLPEDNIKERIMKNIDRLFELLTSITSDGIKMNSKEMTAVKYNFPVL